jgi:EAL domain-containing protein (putative c-di-GMP-specific phosphodiesterase class I)
MRFRRESESFHRRAFVTTLRTGVALPGPILRRLLVAVGLTELVLFVGGAAFLILISASNDSGYYLAVVVSVVVAVLALQAIAVRIMLRSSLEEQRRLLYLRHKIEAVLATGSLRMAFQPIFRASDGVQVGVEALARFEDPACTDTERWFSGAEQVGLIQELELLAVRSALRGAADLPAPLYLALNVSPSTFISPALAELLLTDSFPSARIVLELTEHAAITDYAPTMAARDRFGAEGITVSIDDVGAGFASFRHIVTIAPDVIKIDRSLVTRIDQDATQEALVVAVLAFAHAVGIVVVAEGVETTGQLQRLTQLGVDELQGWLLGPPQIPTVQESPKRSELPSLS